MAELEGKLEESRLLLVALANQLYGRLAADALLGNQLVGTPALQGQDADMKGTVKVSQKQLAAVPDDDTFSPMRHLVDHRFQHIQVYLRPAPEEKVPISRGFFIQLADLLRGNPLALDQFMQFLIIEQLPTELFGHLARDRKTVASKILRNRDKRHRFLLWSNEGVLKTEWPRRIKPVHPV
ncbi:MAG: hypothetical protein H6R38_581 [Deltaproteobacteria bacterium]|nr:hypothetical protein [Deltaproteobacteria bacterium]